MAVEEKSMVPTVLVGVGGTGTEVLSRVRRLVEETYGSLDNLPIISFLIIDTDKDYKVSNPLSAGSSFKDNEKYWASVSSAEIRARVANMSNFPWIDSWFPRELERNVTTLERGAGQIRACGRFAFFCNYHGIQRKFREACDRVRRQEDVMQKKHGIKVSTNSINVFVIGSLSGGTGSGMLIDIGYAIRQWLAGEQSPETTAIVPMPNAFTGINVGDRVLANGYAALIELSYFSDQKTEYTANYSAGNIDEIRDKSSPFDFTYLVGTKNGKTDFSLDQIREMIAQNIFLDLTSDFAPHKRSIRDNIKQAWASQDPGGRGYPKNFMSFGLSTIEIPIFQIRTYLSNQLARDLVDWWLNESVILPPERRDFVTSILKGMRLTEVELIADLSAAKDRSYMVVISEWINNIRQEIITNNRLQCTHKGLNVFGAENGKIMQFLDYIRPLVNEYRGIHLREFHPDERVHGDFFQRMYDNRDQIIARGRDALEKEIYRILEDRTQGLKFANSFVEELQQILIDMNEKFRSQSENLWQKNEEIHYQQYEKDLQKLNSYKDKFGISKQETMEECCESALTSLEGWLVAIIQRKSRTLGLEVIARLREYLDDRLRRHLTLLDQRLKQARDYFQTQSNEQANRANALQINGIKLYNNRQELNSLYQDFIEQQAGAKESTKTEYQNGIDSICSTMSVDVLQAASRLWSETRAANEFKRLFDLPNIPDVYEDDFRAIIAEKTQNTVKNAPENSKLKRELAACNLLFQTFKDEAELNNNIRIAYDKSNPLILLLKAVTDREDANFTPARNAKVALLGGSNTDDPAARKLLPRLQVYISGNDAITPLGKPEHHRIVFVQEIGGFSLRCIDGMRELRKAYQDWKGETIIAKRAQLRGEYRELPIPVHICKEPPFWDVFPDDPNVLKLVVLARALGILRLEENRASKENVIRYTRVTPIGPENVDVASNWEETTQNLEVVACREDREEIQRQVTKKITSAETPQQKQQLLHDLVTYLKKRATDLQKQGGEDSQDYKRERAIILATIRDFKLENTQPPPETSCPKCGTLNPASFKFCSNCGGRLVGNN